MGRAVRIASVIVLVVGLGACGDPAQPALDDLLYLQTGAGVTVVRGDAREPTLAAAGGVPSYDWSTVVGATARRGRTQVEAFAPWSATELWSRSVNGAWQTKVVSADGNLTALGPKREPYWQYGRTATSLMVAGSQGKPRLFGLNGNYEPEAFSTDGSNLFVLEYSPPRRPNRYQVRRLDLETGLLHDVYTPDAHLQRSMRGTARVQAASSDGRRLYTLYTLKTHHGTEAFVHVLSLDELWAHCVDLPADFAVAPESATLAVSKDRDRLYVANGATGAIAEIDPVSLAVTRESDVNFGRGKLSHASADAKRLYLASGSRLTAIDLADLQQSGAWDLPDMIGGIQLGRDGRNVYVALKRTIVVLDMARGVRVKTIDPPGVGRIDRLGRVGRSVEGQIPDKLVCAC